MIRVAASRIISVNEIRGGIETSGNENPFGKYNSLRYTTTALSINAMDMQKRVKQIQTGLFIPYTGITVYYPIKVQKNLDQVFRMAALQEKCLHSF
jgi:hypothetical protein